MSKPPFEMNAKARRLLWELVRPGYRWAVVAGAANLGAALFEGATIGFLVLALHALAGSFPAAGQTLPRVVSGLGRERAFVVLVLLAIGAQLFRSLLQFTGCWATAHLQAKVQVEGFQRIFRRIMELPFQRVASHRLGDLTHLLQESQWLHQFLAQMNLLVRSGLLAATYAGILLTISWQLSLLAFGVYALVSRLLRRVILEVKRHADSLAEAAQRLHERSTELVQGIRLVHTFGRRGQSLRSVQEIAGRGASASRNTAIWGSVLEPVVDSLMVLGAGFFLLSGYVWLGSEAKQTLPSLLAFVVALHRMSPRIGAIHSSLSTLASTRPHLKRITDFLLQTAEPSGASSGATRRFAGLRRSIELREVTLRYRPDEPPALERFSCRIPRGSLTALVGASGSGKSSVLDLLIRLYEPTSGQIFVDGEPMEFFSVDSWRERMGVVAQDPFFFHATIRENIAFGDPGATPEKILAAARAAHA
jgi:ABC-type bacteriocin/lantibiotic exporter with double-glycine peptidase domain